MSTTVAAPPLSLDLIQIAQPCPYEWDKMAGDDRVRRCDGCSMNVYNIASLTRPEAEALLRTHEGRLCLRLYRRTDGTILTRRCPRAVIAAAGWAWRRVAATVTLVLMLLAGAVALAAGNDARLTKQFMDWTGQTADKLRAYEPFKTLWGAPPPVPGRMMLGAIACPPTPPPPVPPATAK